MGTSVDLFFQEEPIKVPTFSQGSLLAAHQSGLIQRMNEVYYRAFAETQRSIMSHISGVQKRYANRKELKRSLGKYESFLNVQFVHDMRRSNNLNYNYYTLLSI